MYILTCFLFMIAALGNVVLCLDYHYNKKVCVSVATCTCIILQESYLRLLLMNQLGRAGEVVLYLLLIY